MSSRGVFITPTAHPEPDPERSEGEDEGSQVCILAQQKTLGGELKNIEKAIRKDLHKGIMLID